MKWQDEQKFGLDVNSAAPHNKANNNIMLVVDMSVIFVIFAMRLIKC